MSPLPPMLQCRVPARRRSASRGSALVLAVAIVVLLSLMGAAYLQVARTDRRSAVEVDTRANVDSSSILAFIGQILAEDVPVTPDGEFPEPYDFPWTNTDPAPAGEEFIVPDRFAPVTVPGPEPDFNSASNNLPARPPRATGNLPDPAGNLFAESGGGDDLWLSSTEPDFAAGTWPHLTNLMGLFLDLRPTELVPDSDGNGLFPTQYLSTADADTESGNVGLPLGVMQADLTAQAMNANAGSRFADASGDGIADSRWTWAPLPSDAGLAYVMAVRIIDNSALINLNAWNDPDLAAGSPDAARWNWPGELQLEETLALVRGNAGVGTLDAADVLGERMTTNSANDRYANWLTTTATRGGDAGNLNAFEEVGSFFEREGGVAGGETFTGLNGTDAALRSRIEEAELRWKNGLNRTDDNLTATGPTPLEALDANFFRSGALELDAADTPYNNTQDFFLDEPRKQLTTLSGSTNAARVNLNSGPLFAVGNVFSEPFSFNGSPANARVPALFDAMGMEGLFSLPAPEENFELGAILSGEHIAAAIKDFRDEDNLFESFGDALGMEQVPVISELYAHARYSATVVSDDGTNQTVDFAFEDVGVVLELVNPWAEPINIEGIELEIAGESWGSLEDLLGSDTMEGHDIATIRRADADAAAVGPAQASLAGEPGVDEDVVKAADVDDYPTNGMALAVVERVNLIAEDSLGEEVVYQSLAVFEFPEEELGVVLPTGTFANGDPAYTFTRVIGTANGFNALAARSVDFARSVNDNNIPVTLADSFAPPADLPMTQFGVASKGVTSTAGGISGTLGMLDARVDDAVDLDATPDPNDEPWTIGNVGRLSRTGDVLQMVFMGPRPIPGAGGATLPIAESWMQSRLAPGATANASGAPDTVGPLRISDYMIDLGEFDPDRFVNDDPKASNSMNFASLWLNRLAVDRNVGTGLIPGRINLNTVTERVLASALPIANATRRQAVAARIVEARNDPQSIGMNPTTDRTGAIGLTAIGEMAGDEALFLNAANNNADLRDFNEAETGVGPGDDDGHVGNREDRNRLISYLHEVAGTRSDIFTAWVLVRAYPATDFSAAPVDEFRLLAVFDRSAVSASNPIPRVLVAERFDDN